MTSTRNAPAPTALPVLATATFAVPSPERTLWAARMNRAHGVTEATTPEWLALDVDDVVIMVDSRDCAFGAEFVIVARDGDRLTLADVTSVSIVRVSAHRAQVEPAGRRWIAHTCGHPALSRRETDGACMAPECFAARITHETATYQSSSVEQVWRVKPSGRALGWQPVWSHAGWSCSCGESGMADSRRQAQTFARWHRDRQG